MNKYAKLDLAAVDSFVKVPSLTDKSLLVRALLRRK